jgi:hypothetical protein
VAPGDPTVGPIRTAAPAAVGEVDGGALVVGAATVATAARALAAGPAAAGLDPARLVVDDVTGFAAPGAVGFAVAAGALVMTGAELAGAAGVVLPEPHVTGRVLSGTQLGACTCPRPPGGSFDISAPAGPARVSSVRSAATTSGPIAAAISLTPIGGLPRRPS